MPLALTLCLSYSSVSQDDSCPGSSLVTQRNLMQGKMHPLPANVSAPCRQLIQAMVQVDTSRRIALEVRRGGAAEEMGGKGVWLAQRIDVEKGLIWLSRRGNEGGGR